MSKSSLSRLSVTELIPGSRNSSTIALEPTGNTQCTVITSTDSEFSDDVSALPGIGDTLHRIKYLPFENHSYKRSLSLEKVSKRKRHHPRSLKNELVVNDPHEPRARTRHIPDIDSGCGIINSPHPISVSRFSRPPAWLITSIKRLPHDHPLHRCSSPARIPEYESSSACPSPVRAASKQTSSHFPHTTTKWPLPSNATVEDSDVVQSSKLDVVTKNDFYLQPQDYAEMLASELPFSSPGLLQRRCEPQDIPKKNTDATNFYEKQQKRWLVESAAPDLNSSNGIISLQQSESLPPPHIFQPIPRHATIPSFLADFDHATLWAENQIDLEPASPTSCISSPVLIHDSTWCNDHGMMIPLERHNIIVTEKLQGQNRPDQITSLASLSHLPDSNFAGRDIPEPRFKDRYLQKLIDLAESQSTNLDSSEGLFYPYSASLQTDQVALSPKDSFGHLSQSPEESLQSDLSFTSIPIVSTYYSSS